MRVGSQQVGNKLMSTQVTDGRNIGANRERQMSDHKVAAAGRTRSDLNVNAVSADCSARTREIPLSERSW